MIAFIIIGVMLYVLIGIGILLWSLIDTYRKEPAIWIDMMQSPFIFIIFCVYIVLIWPEVVRGCIKGEPPI